MFAGLTSRWTRPLPCAAPSALATGAMMSTRAPGRAALLLEPVLRVGAVDVAHRDPEDAVFLAGLVDRDDVRMVERGREPRLAREPLAEGLILASSGASSLSATVRSRRRCSAGGDACVPGERRAAGSDPVAEPASVPTRGSTVTCTCRSSLSGRAGTIRRLRCTCKEPALQRCFQTRAPRRAGTWTGPRPCAAGEGPG